MSGPWEGDGLGSDRFHHSKASLAVVGMGVGEGQCLGRDEGPAWDKGPLGSKGGW